MEYGLKGAFDRRAARRGSWERLVVGAALLLSGGLSQAGFVEIDVGNAILTFDNAQRFGHNYQSGTLLAPQFLNADPPFNLTAGVGQPAISMEDTWRGQVVAKPGFAIDWVQMGGGYGFYAGGFFGYADYLMRATFNSVELPDIHQTYFNQIGGSNDNASVFFDPTGVVGSVTMLVYQHVTVQDGGNIGKGGLRLLVNVVPYDGPAFPPPPPLTLVPEPGTFALLAFGLLMLLAVRRSEISLRKR